MPLRELKPEISGLIYNVVEISCLTFITSLHCCPNILVIHCNSQVSLVCDKQLMKAHPWTSSGVRWSLIWISLVVRWSIIWICLADRSLIALMTGAALALCSDVRSSETVWRGDDRSYDYCALDRLPSDSLHSDAQLRTRDSLISWCRPLRTTCLGPTVRLSTVTSQVTGTLQIFLSLVQNSS